MNLLIEREWNVGYRNEDGDLIARAYTGSIVGRAEHCWNAHEFSAIGLARRYCLAHRLN
jgi:hypothetical protein